MMDRRMFVLKMDVSTSKQVMARSGSSTFIRNLKLY
uniref:Uncharacterized protein n=1 Tax=Arundo donax TaxID=35708 RepID=A0A0A9GLV5_ARUDO